MDNASWIISLIFFIIILVGMMELFSMSKRQKQLEEKLDEIHQNLRELKNTAD
ncbi:hypothetical protein [Ornithinibacillus halophilus]|uniref:Uncharacterized protein n=1 Tax=Ornithinibacillus halophilus TaxID=930117 RepID=A0A1M5JZD5_9BACI|nr:hypothetical protein [Ornithinibacillus halophilus]SHG45393.1 hypothetical protein SAMN05216225_103418 [Ornithinibacillus halophilus]